MFGRIFVWLRGIVDGSLQDLHHKVEDCVLHQLFIGIEGLDGSVIVGKDVVTNEPLEVKVGVERIG